MDIKEEIIKSLDEKIGCGKEVYMTDGEMEEDGIFWKCGEQFNTDIVCYCDECKKRFEK